MEAARQQRYGLMECLSKMTRTPFFNMMVNHANPKAPTLPSCEVSVGKRRRQGHGLHLYRLTTLLANKQLI